MSGHISTERMHDLLDGLLPSETAAPARAHLDECALCRDAFAELSELVTDLRTLPREAEPPEELWSGIAAKIGGTAPGATRAPAEVLPFPMAPGIRRPFALSGLPLLAAGLVVSLMSAGLVWMAMSRTGTGPADVPVSLSSAEQTDALRAAARSVASGETAYVAALAELSAIVEQGRGLLAPETVEALDASLAVIDAAIADIEEALLADPSSELLSGMLVSRQRAKLRVLNQAATHMQERI